MASHAASPTTVPKRLSSPALVEPAAGISSASMRRIGICSSVAVTDVDQHKQVGTMADTPGIHGIASADDLPHGFTHNSKRAGWR
ncbi:MAG: hypothetical protein ACTS5I_01740 [Rhodanobacter sp.]